MTLGLLAAAALSFSAPAGEGLTWGRPPAMDISAIRMIDCDQWAGSGFIIGKGIMATANHVMEGATGCRDVASGASLKAYKTDKAHDLTLVTGNFPSNIPYVKYSCEPFHPGESYLAYGITGYMQSQPIIRNNVLVATRVKTGSDFKFDDGMSIVGARVLTGYAAPGMSGGPVADLNGYAHGLTTGGSGDISYDYEFADGMLCK